MSGLRGDGVLALLITALVAFSAFDYAMRADAAALCQYDDRIACPATLSIWADLYTAF